MKKLLNYIFFFFLVSVYGAEDLDDFLNSPAEGLEHYDNIWEPVDNNIYETLFCEQMYEPAGTEDKDFNVFTPSFPGSPQDSPEAISNARNQLMDHINPTTTNAYHKIENLPHNRRIHTGKKQHKCSWPNCPYTTTRKGDLTAHRRIHTGEKPYRCDDCDFATAQKGNLTVHKKIHTGEKQYRFKDCLHTTAQKGDLTKHRRIHTGEKPYRCDDCDFATAQKGNLTKHRKIHTEEKQYRWTEYDYASAQKKQKVY